MFDHVGLDVEDVPASAVSHGPALEALGLLTLAALVDDAFGNQLEAISTG